MRSEHHCVRFAIYVRYTLSQAISGVHVGPRAAAEALATVFGGNRLSGGGRPMMTVMLVDEMDQMLKGRQVACIPPPPPPHALPGAAHGSQVFGMPYVMRGQRCRC